MMKIERELGAAAQSPPFLSVVTRCYRRPNMLKRNIASLAAQTDPDYEHVRLVDDAGYGVHGANRALADASPRGRYVLVLDDDDLLSEPEAIALLKLATVDLPDLVVFRANHAGLGVLPSRDVWGKRPMQGQIGSCDFISRCDVWQRHIHAFGAPSCGDFAYLNAVWREAPAVVWLDRQLAAVQRISRGAPGLVPA